MLESSEQDLSSLWLQAFSCSVKGDPEQSLMVLFLWLLRAVALVTPMNFRNFYKKKLFGLQATDNFTSTNFAIIMAMLSSNLGRSITPVKQLAFIGRHLDADNFYRQLNNCLDPSTTV